MMRRIALVIGLVVLTTACTTTTPADAEIQSYFDQVQAAAERYNERLDEAETASEAGLDQSADDGTFDADLVVALKQLYSDGVVITRDFVADLAAINPPAEAVDEHAETIDIGSQLVTALEALGTELTDIDQLEVLQTAVGQSQAAALIVDFDRTCIVLEALAIENGARVELNCGG
ncbi:MAG: hypothetical protein HKN01_12345 [Acidimicrobiia bacterium]|nr:hypothetical protein [Acidimicrobiia bacterium]NNF70553.1 hypothetical protein [Acidimicrobiia bacterium]NNK92395.1 hypothetical protein [Acidimicrobiia bacterium]